jgi:hypothetical protein
MQSQMKNILSKLVCSLLIGASFTSCLQEDIIATPAVAGIKYYINNSQGKDSLISQPIMGRPVKIMVATDSDICSVWPGGNRIIMKKKTSADGVTFADSTDMFNHPVLVSSDMYSDYGLIGARGLKTTLSNEGWYCTYTYPKSGEFDLTIVVTNHGYKDNQYRQAVVEIGKVQVK